MNYLVSILRRKAIGGEGREERIGEVLRASYWHQRWVIPNSESKIARKDFCQFMSKTYSQPFDFEEWMLLAKSDPEEFEKRRKHVIDDLISSAPEDRQQRLRGLQWRIDSDRKRCSNPLAACIRLSDMMWDFVFAEKGFLNALKMLGAAHSGVETEEKELRSAEILPFKARGSR